MVGMPGFWARFLAFDQTARGGGGRKYSFAGLLEQKIRFYSSTGTENTVLQF